MPRRVKRPRVLQLLVALIIAAAALPASAQAFSKAIWGAPYVHGVNQFPMYKRLGVRIDEADLVWSQVAPTRPRHPTNPRDPAYRWPASIAQIVALAKRYHMQVMLQMIMTPRWANGGHAPNVPPRSAASFAAFATAAARKYPSVHLWMVWGEPSRTPNFSITPHVPPGSALTPAQAAAPHRYAQLLDGAYGALKAVDPFNRVIGGATYTTGDIDTQQWIENLRLPNGRPPRMDMYAHNPFSFQAPSFSDPLSPMGEVQFSDLHELAGWVDRYLRRGLPLFLSEFTIPSQADEEFNYYVDEPVAAQWVTDALSLSRRWRRIDALGWIHVYDEPPVSYGGLLSAQGRPKPDFYAFARG